MKSQCKSEPWRATYTTAPCEVLGPFPAKTVAALADLGLTDQEIASYFHVLPERITRLRLKDAPELWLVCGGDAATTLDLDRK